MSRNRTPALNARLIANLILLLSIGRELLGSTIYI